MLMAPAGLAAGAPPPSLGVQSPAQQSARRTFAAAAAEPPPPREENPGLINELGKLWDKLLPKIKSPSRTPTTSRAPARAWPTWQSPPSW